MKKLVIATTQLCKTFGKQDKNLKLPYLENCSTKFNLAASVLQVIDRPLKTHW